MRKEIEVKAKVDDLRDVRLKLETLGCSFSEPLVQDDTIFVNFDGDFTKVMKTNYLRIRKIGSETLFTLKQPQENELDCIEKEVAISDPDEFREALELMGYHEVVQVYKTRVKTRYKDMEICLDDVKDLGTFVEVERIVDGDGEEVQQGLFDFLQTLGVKKEDRVLNGYDTLIYKKANHVKNEIA